MKKLKDKFGDKTTYFGGDPNFIDKRTTREKIEYELKIKQEENSSGKMMGFLSVDLQIRGNMSDITITAIIDAITTPEQIDAIRDHLWDIGDILKNIYKKSLTTK